MERLQSNYQKHITLPWQAGLSGAERVIFVVYDPDDERRIRARVGAFELAARNAGHGWALADITDSFGHWMAGQKRKDQYFAEPDILQPVLKSYDRYLVENIAQTTSAAKLGQNDVLAIVGAGALFGLSFVSQIIDPVARAAPSRILVFFPGQWADKNYRLLDAREGWNYLAVPITD
jgi:hypothetical protein